MDIREHNRRVWNRRVELGNPWTVPVTSEEVAAARAGQWHILLTPRQPVPDDWFPRPLGGKEVLGLASGGGQQGPLLAAAGARVTILDNSPAQLAGDRQVAEQEGLTIKTVEGDMGDLGLFADASFDLIVHPVSNSFVPDLSRVWREAFRVLRPGGALLSGFARPLLYLFDDEEVERTGELRVRHRLPYADSEALTEAEQERYLALGWALEFSHTLEAQIGGQLDAGFLLAGFYEDRYAEEEHLLSGYTPTFAATQAIKLGATAADNWQSLPQFGPYRR